jgi:hypothetical protein
MTEILKPTPTLVERVKEMFREVPLINERYSRFSQRLILKDNTIIGLVKYPYEVHRFAIAPKGKGEGGTEIEFGIDNKDGLRFLNTNRGFIIKVGNKEFFRDRIEAPDDMRTHWIDFHGQVMANTMVAWLEKIVRDGKYSKPPIKISIK